MSEEDFQSVRQHHSSQAWLFESIEVLKYW